MSNNYSGSSSGSGQTYTLPPGTSLTVPFSVPENITDAQIQSMFPGIEFINNPAPGDNAPPKPDNFWAYVGRVMADEVNLWILKKLGWLLVLEAIEPAGPED